MSSHDIAELHFEDLEKQSILASTEEELFRLCQLSSLVATRDSPPDNISIVGDHWHDIDDPAATLITALFHKFSVQKLISATAVLAYLHKPVEGLSAEETATVIEAGKKYRAQALRGGLDVLGLSEVPVFYGRSERVDNPGTGVHIKETCDFERDNKLQALAMKSGRGNNLDSFDSGYSRMNKSGGQHKLLITSGLETVGTLFAAHPDLYNKISEVLWQGGTYFNDDGILSPTQDASNFKFAKARATDFFRDLQEQGITTHSHHKEAPLSVAGTNVGFFENLAGTGNVYGDELYRVAQNLPKTFYNNSRKRETTINNLDWKTLISRMAMPLETKEGFLASTKAPEWSDVQKYATIPQYDGIVALASAGKIFTDAWGMFDPTGFTGTEIHRNIGWTEDTTPPGATQKTSVAHGGVDVSVTEELLKTFMISALRIANTEEAANTIGTTSLYAHRHGYRINMTQQRNGEWMTSVSKMEE